MNQKSTEKDISDAFIKNTAQKLKELNAIYNIMIKEGIRTDFFDSIYRITNTIKIYASTCGIDKVVDFINDEIEKEFKDIQQKNEALTEDIKQNLKTKLLTLSKLILKNNP